MSSKKQIPGQAIPLNTGISHHDKESLNINKATSSLMNRTNNYIHIMRSNNNSLKKTSPKKHQLSRFRFIPFEEQYKNRVSGYSLKEKIQN